MKKIFFLFFWLAGFSRLVWASYFCEAEVGDSCTYNSTPGREYENTCCSQSSNESLICNSAGEYELNYTCCDDQKCQQFFEIGRIPAHVCAPINMSCERGERICDMSYKDDDIISNRYFTCSEYKQWDVLSRNLLDVEELYRCENATDGDLRSVEPIDLQAECEGLNGTWHDDTNPLKCSYPAGYRYNYCTGELEKSFEFPIMKIQDFEFFHHEKKSDGEWEDKFAKGSENSNEIKINDGEFPNSDFSKKETNSATNWKLKNSECLKSGCEDEILKNGTFKVAFEVEFKNPNENTDVTFKNIQIPFVVRQKHGFTLPFYKYEIESDGSASFFINNVELKLKEYSNKNKCENNGHRWDDGNNSCEFVFRCDENVVNCNEKIIYKAEIDKLTVGSTKTEKIKIQLYFSQESFWGEDYQFNEDEIKLKYDYEYTDEDNQNQSEHGKNKILTISKIILNNKPFNQFPENQKEWWQTVGGGVYVEKLVNETPINAEKDENGDNPLTTNLHLKNQTNSRYNVFSVCQNMISNSLATKKSTYYKNICSPFLNTSLREYYSPQNKNGPFGGLIMYQNGRPYKDAVNIDSNKYRNQLSNREGTCLASNSECNASKGTKIEDDQFSLEVDSALDVGTYQYYFNLAKSKHQEFYDLLGGSLSAYAGGCPSGSSSLSGTTNNCKFIKFPKIDDPSQEQENLLCYFDDVTIDQTNSWVVSANYPITIFANSLTIKGDSGSNDSIPIKVEDDSYLGFFIRDNITIDENVGSINRQSDECLKKGYPAFFAGSRNNGTGVKDNVCYSKDFFTDEEEHLNGVFFTDGELIIESDGNLSSIDRKLNLKGIYIAKGGVEIKRSYGNGVGKNIKHLNPIVRFIFNPDLNLTAPEWLKKSRKIYQEVN